MTQPNKKAPHPVDKKVGARVRARRLMLDMSQTGLGDACSLTFQQIQKYEKGTNRISMSRMAQIAKVLKCDPSYFFGDDKQPNGRDVAGDELDELIGHSDAIRLLRAFAGIEGPARAHFVHLAESWSKGA